MSALTTERLAQYVGGQLEVQNELEGYLYRGEIATIEVQDGELRARMAWMAQADGIPPQGWVNSDRLDYAVSLEIYAVSEIGPGMVGGARLLLNSEIVGEVVALFPPDGSKLDPRKVVGLTLPNSAPPAPEGE
jgi:hypothetical protein